MPCYSPIRLKRYDDRGLPVIVACGKCVGCHLEYSRTWAVRCMHEGQMHDQNCMVTLTYRDSELVYGYLGPTLVPKHLQNFMKNLRKKYGPKIKFFGCGEYGERRHRPHYHACLFGVDFEDKKLDSKNPYTGVENYTSRRLDAIWGHGDCHLGALTFESAAYVARYVLKKSQSDSGPYSKAAGIQPEFIRMSRRPGIGSSWLDKYYTDVFPHDSVIVRGVKQKCPKYYRDRYSKMPTWEDELTNLEKISILNNARKKAMDMHFDDNTTKRLNDKEVVKKAQIRNLKRALDS